MQLFVIAALIASAIFTLSLNNQIEYQSRAKQGAITGKWISRIVRGYTAKAINEEAGDGTHFGNLALTDGATWSISGEDLVYFLMSDGSTGDANQPACTDSSGNVIGLGPYNYVPCGTLTSLPGGGSTLNSVTFTRKATAAVRPGYTTGFSQITGEFVFGGNAGDVFSMDGTGYDDIKIADAIESWLAVSGFYPDFDDTTYRTLTQAPVISYGRNDVGGITATIDFMQGSQMAITKDGAIPFEGDQSMGVNNLTDVKELYWGTVTAGTKVSTLDENGNIVLYGEGSKLDFDGTGGNQIELTTDGLLITSPDLEVSSDVSLTGSGAHLSNVTQVRGYLTNGDDVDFPVCKTVGAEQVSIGAPAILAQDLSDPQPLYGWYPVITKGATAWTITYYGMVEGNAYADLDPETKIPYETWCDE